MKKTSSWYVRFTIEKGCVHVSGSTYLHMCIGLAKMEGVVDIMSMADELLGKPNEEVAP